MSRNFFFLFLIIISSIFIAGCGDECMSEDDWRDSGNKFAGKCYEYSCSKVTDYKVKPIPVKGCTYGNGKCDDGTKGNPDLGETRCNSPSDCTPSCGKSSGEYIKEQCFDKFSGKLCEGKIDEKDPCECVSDINQDKITMDSSTIKISKSGLGTFSGKIEYQKPFDLKRSTVNVNFQIGSWATGVQEVTVTGVEIYGKKNKVEMKLGELLTDKTLWSENMEFIDKIILHELFGDDEGTVTSLRMVVKIDYFVKGIPKSAEVTQTFKLSELEYIKPSRDIACTIALCNDNNPGTKDECMKQGTAFCVYSPIANKCGNYKCDVSEDKCTCPIDCGPCDGAVGSYMQYSCVAKKCQATLDPKVETVKQVTKELSKTVGPYLLKHEIVYNTPYINLQKDTIAFNIILANPGKSVGALKIKSISIFKDSTSRWMKLTVSASLAKIDDVFYINLPLKSVPVLEEEALGALKFKVDYEYPVQSGDTATTKVGTYEVSLTMSPKVSFINPVSS